jgi:phenylalanyl-tRNA synthetase alpha chain
VDRAVDVEQLQGALLSDVAQAPDLPALEQLRVAALGKKGRITSLTKSLGSLDADARRTAGQRFNLLKETVAQAIAGRTAALDAVALDAQVQRV